MTVRVTGHAVSRYRRRVEPVSYDQAVDALSSPMIQQAVNVGAASVLLPSGHRVVLVGGTVVTVKAKHCDKRTRRRI